RRGVPDLRLSFATDQRDHAAAPSFLVAMAPHHRRIDALRTAPPAQRRQINAMRVEPCALAGDVPVKPLLDVTGPAAFPASAAPAPAAWWFQQPRRGPAMAVGRVSQHATVASHRRQRGSEAAAIVAKPELMWLSRTAVPVAAPSRARRMRHDRPRAVIGACIALLGPQLDVRQSR